MFLVSVAILFFIYTALSREGRLVGRIPKTVLLALQRPSIAPLCVAVLVVLQLAFLALVRDATLDQQPVPRWFALMPIAIVDDRDGRFHIAASYGDRFTVLAVLESLALFSLYWSYDLAGKSGRRFVIVGAAIMWGTALASPAATSGDMYSYVGHTLFWRNSYAPPHAAFTGEFLIINLWWGAPLPAAPYGPLWFALSTVMCAPLPTLLAKIAALRFFDGIVLVLIIAALRARGIPARALMLVALNPAMLFEFIVNVHNDLAAVLAILVAGLFARRNLALAIFVAICAGLIKLPYVLIAALALFSIPSLRTRLAAYTTIVTATLTVSWIFGGPAYLAVLRAHATVYGGTHFSQLLLNPLTLPKLLAVFGIGLALVTNNYIEGGAWMLPCLSATLFPWYLVAGIPYASYDERVVRNFLLALPLATLATDTAIGNGVAIVSLALAASLLALAGIVRRARGIRKPSQRPLWWLAIRDAAEWK